MNTIWFNLCRVTLEGTSKFKHATLCNLGTKAETSPCKATTKNTFGTDEFQKAWESGQVRPFMSKKT